MSLLFSKQEIVFQNKVRSFMEKHLAPITNEVEHGRFPREILEKMGQEHLLGSPFSKSDGGQGLGWSFELIVAEEVSAVSAATEMARLASAALYSAPLAYFGNKTQKQQFLTPVLSGKQLGALALTEPNAGSDTGSITTTAKKHSGYYLLNGEKRFITNGGVADYIFVFAITNSKVNVRNGLSGFVVPRESDGLTVEQTYDLLGMRGSNVARLRFRNVKVPEENLVGGLNRGFTVLLDELDRERPTVSAGMIGIARSAFQAAAKYSMKRIQFGKPINKFEGVSFKIADMAVKLEAARLLTLYAVRVLDEKRPATKLGAIAKLFSTEAAFHIANQALQIHGGIGYTSELPVERYFRDARFMMIGGGTSEIMKYVIQREVYREMI